MPPSRPEFERLMVLKQEQGKKLHEAHLALVKQAALKVDYVTKNEHWDYYLSLLQPKLDQARTEELQWLANTAEAHKAEDFHVAQRNYFSWRSKREALEEVMELPTKLLAASQANDAQPA